MTHGDIFQEQDSHVTEPIEEALDLSKVLTCGFCVIKVRVGKDFDGRRHDCCCCCRRTRRERR